MISTRSDRRRVSTQHWGFNLEASIREGPNLNIRDHYATVNANHIVTVDPHLLPDGTLTPTAGTGHWHQGKKIGDQFVEGGYGQSTIIPNRHRRTINRGN